MAVKKPVIRKLASDTGLSATDRITADGTPKLSGTAPPGTKVVIRDGNKVIGTVTANNSGQWSFTTKALADGEHKFTAKAMKGTQSSPYSAAFKVTIDKTAPSPPSTPDLAAASDTGTSASDDRTGDDTPTFTGTAAAGSTVTLREGATILGSAVADGGGTWSITTSVLSEGAHTVTATATDVAGNTSAASSGTTITVDRTAPGAPSTPDLDAASDTGSSATDNLTNDPTPTFTGTTEPGATVTLKEGDTVLGTAVADQNGDWTITASALSEGEHTITATATDAAGNESVASAGITITVDTTGPSAPTGLDLATADDTGTSSTDNLTKTTDNLTITGSGIDGLTVTLFDDADNDGAFDEGETVLGTGTVSGGTFSIDVDLAEGVHHVRAFQTDAAGNAGTASGSLDITVDTTGPAASIALDPVTADNVVNLLNGESVGNVAITGTVGGDVPDGATVTVTVNGVDYTGAVSAGAFSINVPGSGLVADGDLKVAASVSVTDAAGNGTTATDTQAYTLKTDLDIDVATMTASDGFRILGADADDRVGRSVSSAGDINGDGFADLIVGAWGSDGAANGTSYAGEAIVVFGKAGGFADIDVSSASFVSSGAGFRIFGADAYDLAGFSVSSAGDINGDGFADLIVGAWGSDGATNGTSYAGEAIVVFGKAGGVADIDMSSASLVSSGAGFRIFGANADDRAGFSVSSAGDVNGDGFADLIVGVRGGDGATNGKANAGEAIVVFGKAGGFADIDVSSASFVSSGAGFRIFGADAYDLAGFSVSSAGDINGDGFADLTVGALGADGPTNGTTYAGEAIVVFGKAGGFADIDVSSASFVSSGAGFRIFGAEADDFAGVSVSSAGDINGDGFADLIVGARDGDGPTNGMSYAGEAIVVFGKAGGGSDIDVSSTSFVSSGAGFRIFGADTNDQTGISVSSAGDINGDGFADLIVGAIGGDGATNGNSFAGEAIVVFGKAGGFSDIDVSSASFVSSGAGFRIFGADAYDRVGFSVSSAGDINGDGFADLIVGADGGDSATNGTSDAGEAIVIFGGDFLGGIVHAGGDGADTLTGTAAAETFVGGRGDDVMTGNGGADSFRGGAGSDTISVADLAFLKVDGGSGVDTVAFDAAGGAIDLTGSTGLRIAAVEKIDLGGGHTNTLVLGKLAVLAMAGSNGEAFAANTLLVRGDAGDRVSLLDGWTKGATVTDPHGETGNFVIWTNGAATLLIEDAVEVYAGDIDAATLSASTGFRIFGADTYDFAGYSTSTAGDINGDGFDDLIVGAPAAGSANSGKSYAGETYVIFGKANGFVDIDLAALAPSDGFRILGADSDDRSGQSVSSAGDVNGDGYADLILGAPGGDAAGNGTAGAGESTVIFGKATGFADIDLATMTAADGFQIAGADSFDLSGWSVAAAGDVNGDGFADLIVGARYADAAGNIKNRAGESYVLFGKATNLTDIDLATLAPGNGFRIFGANANDRSGRSVASAGDVNGDGFADLIVGAYFGNGPDNTVSHAGESYVIYGKATGVADIDLDALTAADGFRIFGTDAGDWSGYSVSSIGDINGDGFSDLIVGAPHAAAAANAKVGAGESTVLFGKATGFTDIDLGALAPGDGFRIFGDAYDESGSSVRSAGDVNGDGYDDLIVGAPVAAAAGNNKIHAGESYVIFGNAAGFADIDLATMTAAKGFRIFGANSYDLSGSSVSSAGDINGDGYDDLIIGAFFADAAGNNKIHAGEAIVIFGGDFLGSVVYAGGDGADTLTGTAAAETFVGGRGDDVMTGNGGANSFRGGAGSDTISVADLSFLQVDGGSGIDTLVLAGLGTIDFTAIADNRVTGIEALDVTGGGGDTIILGALDVLHFSDTPHAGFTGAASHQRLVVHGDVGDTLDLRDFDPGSGGAYEWQLAASDRNLDGSAGGGFDLYNLVRNAAVVASVAVDADMAIL